MSAERDEVGVRRGSAGVAGQDVYRFGAPKPFGIARADGSEA